MQGQQNVKQQEVRANLGIYYKDKAIFRKKIQFPESFVLFGILLYDKKNRNPAP